MDEVEFRKAADAAIEELKQELYASEDDGTVAFVPVAQQDALVSALNDVGYSEPGQEYVYTQGGALTSSEIPNVSITPADYWAVDFTPLFSQQTPSKVIAIRAGKIFTAAEKNYDDFRKELRQGMSYLVFTNLIASVLLIVLATPIIRLLFERGVYVTLAAYPLAPKAEVGFRVQLTAVNTDAEVDTLIEAITELAERGELQLASAPGPSESPT